MFVVDILYAGTLAAPEDTGTQESEGAGGDEQPAGDEVGNRASMSVSIRVIPCLDVDQGRVVKGVNFENLRDAGDPVELARRYDAEGADEIRSSTSPRRRATARRRTTSCRTAEQVFVPLTVGGGMQHRGHRQGCSVQAPTRSASTLRRSPDLKFHQRDRGTFRLPGPRDLGGRASLPGGYAHRVRATRSTTHGGRRGTGVDAVEWAARAAGSAPGRSS